MDKGPQYRDCSAALLQVLIRDLCLLGLPKHGRSHMNSLGYKLHYREIPAHGGAPATPAALRTRTAVPTTASRHRSPKQKLQQAGTLIVGICHLLSSCFLTWIWGWGQGASTPMAFPLLPVACRAAPSTATSLHRSLYIRICICPSSF